ncbi:MAG: transglutaminase domain-containing protein [Butyricicoccus sp.]
MKQRFFALLLAAAMLPALFPTAYAEESAEEILIGEEDTAQPAEIPTETEEESGTVSIRLQDEPAEQTVIYTDTLGAGKPSAGRISTAAVHTNSTSSDWFFGDLDDEGSRALYDAMDTALRDNPIQWSGNQVVIHLEEDSTALRTLSGTLKGDSREEIEQKVRGAVCNAYAAYNYDHPEVFWIGKDIEQENTFLFAEGNGSDTASVSAMTLKISSPFSEQSLPAARNQFAAELNAAAAAANQGNTAYQKLRLAHDYLCGSVTYTAGAARAYSAYGALVDKKAVCEGYSRAMKAVCDMLGIPCVCISGTAVSKTERVSHMWNAVSLDSRWYAVDCTWDDTAGKSAEDSAVLHTFFLVGSGTSAPELELGKFSATHQPSGLLYESKDAETIKTFAYPMMSASAYTGEHIVDAIRLNCGSALSMNEGDQQTVRLSVYPESARGVKLVWKTSNRNVAAVSAGESGRAEITAVGGGTAVISVTADDISASCAVKVTPKLSTPKMTSALTRVGGVQVKWECVSGANGYRICRRTSGGSWTKIAEVSGAMESSYTDYSVRNNTTYAYTVYALYDGQTASGCSSSGKSAYYLRTPEILTISNRSSGIRLTWNSVSKATEYSLYRKSPKDKKWTKIAVLGAKTTDYTDKKVSNHNTYIYTLRAGNSKGMSYYHTAGSTLRRISQVSWSSLKRGSAKTLTARWKRVAYVTGYELQYSTKSSMKNAKTIRVKSSGSSVLSKTVGKLTGGRTYYVRIRAYKSLDDGRTYGAWSSTKRVTVKR